MATLKADVILQDALYEQLATLANEMQVSQNELLTLAIEDYLKRYRQQKLQQSWNDAYDDDLDADEQATLQAMRRHQRQLIDTVEEA